MAGYGLAPNPPTSHNPSCALPGNELVLFAIARTVGWIAHASEQLQHDGLIRPRARISVRRRGVVARHPERKASGRIGLLPTS